MQTVDPNECSFTSIHEIPFASGRPRDKRSYSSHIRIVSQPPNIRCELAHMPDVQDVKQAQKTI